MNYRPAGSNYSFFICRSTIKVLFNMKVFLLQFGLSVGVKTFLFSPTLMLQEHSVANSEQHFVLHCGFGSQHEPVKSGLPNCFPLGTRIE